MQLYDDFHVILDLSRACFTLLKKFFGASLFDSKLPNNESQFQSTSSYRFSICNYQICLWLTIASMNRLNESFSEAQAAIAEAEATLDLMIRKDQKIRNTKSRVFPSINLKKNSSRGFKDVKIAKKTSLSFQGAAEIIGKWGVLEMTMRRIMADISFEVCIINLVLFITTG